jgi:hypothetical protein
MMRSWLLTIALLVPAIAAAQYPWEWLKDGGFKTAYVKALGSKSKERWLMELPGPSVRSRSVAIGVRDYVLLQSCKPHDCADRNVVLIYDRDANVVYGKLKEEHAITWLGNPAPELQIQLDQYYEQAFAR